MFRVDCGPSLGYCKDKTTSRMQSTTVNRVYFLVLGGPIKQRPSCPVKRQWLWCPSYSILLFCPGFSPFLGCSSISCPRGRGLTVLSWFAYPDCSALTDVSCLSSCCQSCRHVLSGPICPVLAVSSGSPCPDGLVVAVLLAYHNYKVTCTKHKMCM